jgi:hypothetical protein
VEEVAAKPVRQTESTGWKAPVVQAAANIHRAAFNGRPDGLTFLLDAARIWVAEQKVPEGALVPTLADYALLPAPEREAFVHAVADRLIQGADKELVADWEPVDGEVINKTDVDATVRVAVTARAKPEDKRTVEWKLALVDGRWKAWAWKRWLTPEEEQAAHKPPPSTRGMKQVTLSDGSRVLEREPAPLGHLDTTPPELRARIDQLYANLIDLSLTSEALQAARELERIGKPAVPILLTGLYEIPLDTMEQGIQVNLIDQVLRGISGRSFGYTPQEIVASGSSNANNEHRRSAITQWFAWWYANQDTFEAEREKQRAAADGAAGKPQLTEREKRLLEQGGR